MIWVTWRQHRGQILWGVALLGILGIFLGITGVQISNTFHSTGLAHCLSVGKRADCPQLAESFDAKYRYAQLLIVLFLIVPIFIGMFWGAPLVAREFENGTHRLAWTQGVSRRRWVTSKLAIISAITLLVAIAWAWLINWWSAPFVAVSPSGFNPGIFDLRGIAPIGYILFALALGVAAGAVLGKTLPAIVATLVGFTAVRVVIDLFARAHYLAAKTLSRAISINDAPAPARDGMADWVLSAKALDSGGHVLWTGAGIRIDPSFFARCPGLTLPKDAPPDPAMIDRCFNQIGAHVVSTYQPASRYWTFQGIEFAIFIVLAAALMIFAVRRLKHAG